jgi:peptidoglycan/LPS O-acetylase OafA/YrhL
MPSDMPRFSFSSHSAVAPPTPSGKLVNRFRRITTSTAYIAEIDGLRFLAIAAVIFYHLPIALRYAPEPQALIPWHLAGQLGVQLFFIISGFVLALPFARHALQGGRKVSLRSYYLRRLTRIEPPYIVCLLLLFVLRNAFSHSEIAPAHLITGLLYIHSLTFGYNNPIDPVAWSLALEVQFYLLLPLFAALFLLRPAVRRRILLFLICTSVVINAVAQMRLQTLPAILHWTVLGYLHFFLIGMWLSEAYIAGKFHRSGWTWDLLAATALVAVVYSHGHRDTGQLGSALGLPVIFVAAFLGRWMKQLMRVPVITAIGGMCYSIYLLHEFVIQSVGTYVRSHPILQRGGLAEYCAAALILYPLAIGISAIFYLLIERPCMDPRWPWKLVKYFTSRKPRTADAAKAAQDVVEQETPANPTVRSPARSTLAVHTKESG